MPDDNLLARIRAEFLEMPGLRLTTAQVHRLCGVKHTLCQQMLDTLVDARFLSVNASGVYARYSEDAATPRARRAKADISTVKHPVRDAHVPLRTQASVLVVDDSADGREMLAAYLGARRFQVWEARNGEEAIDLARRLRPDVILMDLSMPDMDGWEATRQLRTDPLTNNTLIIAVSAHAYPHEQQSALAAGCDAVVAKPFDVGHLADALERVLTDGHLADDLLMSHIHGRGVIDTRSS
jgi:two-component system cell cycle response regulator DivK